VLYYPTGAHFYTNKVSIIAHIAENTLIPFSVAMFLWPCSLNVFDADGSVTLTVSLDRFRVKAEICYLREDEVWQSLGEKFLELIVSLGVVIGGYQSPYEMLAASAFYRGRAEEYGFLECVAEWKEAYNLGKGAAAYRRAEALLKSQLQQWQLDEYNSQGKITVFGGRTNYRYEIHKGGSYNVLCYQPNGVYRLCVTTAERGIPAPDKMLSQMYMIELDEDKFRKTANWAKA